MSETLDIIAWADGAAARCLELFVAAVEAGEHDLADRIADYLFRLRDRIYRWHLDDMGGRPS